MNMCLFQGLSNILTVRNADLFSPSKCVICTFPPDGCPLIFFILIYITKGFGSSLPEFILEAP